MKPRKQHKGGTRKLTPKMALKKLIAANPGMSKDDLGQAFCEYLEKNPDLQAKVIREVFDDLGPAGFIRLCKNPETKKQMLKDALDLLGPDEYRRMFERPMH